jgi:cation diffusion facilitator family transporter
MTACCEEKSCAIERLRERQLSTLKAVLAINIVLFGVELSAGLLAGSSALMSDSLDNLGDALTYGLSMYAVGRGARIKSLIAIFKALLILVAGILVLAQVLMRVAEPSLPVFQTMGIVSLIALAANSICLFLLTRHREDDVNMQSVWECSRNDIASNVSVFVAGMGVWFTRSAWPDLVVGLALAMLFLYSSAMILRSAISTLRKA